MKESMNDLTKSFLSVFNTYYDDAEDDYSDVPLVEPNLDYGGWRYLEDRADSDGSITDRIIS